MIDVLTNQPLRISRSTAGGRLRVALSQHPQAKRVLDEAGIPCWSDGVAVSVDGRPSVTGITFSWKADLDKAQQVLDAVR